MALSYNEFTSRNPGDNIIVNFPFISRDHVHVVVDGLDVPSSLYTWSNDSLIVCRNGFPSGGGRVERRTVTGSLVSTQVGGSVFDFEAVNTNDRQLLFAYQEAVDQQEVLSSQLAQGITDADGAAQRATDASVLAIQAAQAAVSQALVPIYPSAALVPSLSVPPGVQSFRVDGGAAVGDGEDGLYVVSPDPADVQSADGRHWRAVRSRYGDLVQTWRADNGRRRVFGGGSRLEVELFPGDGGTSGIGGGTSAVGRTFVSNTVTDSIRQDGLVRAVRVRNSFNAGMAPRVPMSGGIRFKHMRPAGLGTYESLADTDAYTLVGTQESEVIRLFSPLGPFLPGDRLGVWLKGDPDPAVSQNIGARGDSGSMSFQSGNLQGVSSAWSVIQAELLVEALFSPPLAVCVGDSIIEGHNGPELWHSWRHQGPAGNPLGEPMRRVSSKLGLYFQNFGLGSSTWAGNLVVAAEIAALSPKLLVIHSGVNDISQGRSWAQVEADMNALIDAMPGGVRVFVNEILPWSNVSDAQAATVREWNQRYRQWCEANSATLIECHDALGQVRPSTGLLDDLKAEYNHDGVHLTYAGVAALGDIIAATVSSRLT
jgi:lysophospholipase L1-like esterase